MRKSKIILELYIQKLNEAIIYIIQTSYTNKEAIKFNWLMHLITKLMQLCAGVIFYPER